MTASPFARLASLVLLLTAAIAARAEVWALANGDRLTGELVSQDNAFIEV